ncbi:MAG: DUF58 domain-containing protein [Gammaproteobacteria bacterium]|nr:DUF58 domain-containing protein [Gammaproteobacteria bacterium]
MRPSGVALTLALLWCAIGVAVAIVPGWQWLWYGSGVVILLALLIDLWLLIFAPIPKVQRHVAGSLPVGVWSPVRIRIDNPGRSRVRLDVFDHYPAICDIEALPQRIQIAPQAWTDMSYRIRPNERGEQQFAQTQVLIHSPLRIWRRNRYLGSTFTIRVYPNFASMVNYALFATENRLSLLGIRKRRRRGEGLDFHQLREYREGDALRQIDWKATSRLKRLISREYQDERDQQVVFLIDCGRRMLAKDGDLAHFDHALNAILLLSYVALRQGDAVGFLAFAGMERFLAPIKGNPSINVMLNSVYDLQASSHVPDYARASTELLKRLRKRSLVVLITNLRDEDADELRPAVSILRRQHLVVLASLQERILTEVQEQPIQDFHGAIRLAATDLFLEERRQAHEALKHYGVMVLDVAPEQLAISLVNRYLDIKLSGRL